MRPSSWAIRLVNYLASKPDRALAVQCDLEPTLCILERVVKRRIRAQESVDLEGLAREIEEWIAEWKTPLEPDIAWAARAVFDGGRTGLYSEAARDLAAEWLANRFRGLPGDSRARSEVRWASRRAAAREGCSERELEREIALAATPEAVDRAGRLPARLWRRENRDLAKALADAMLAFLRRDLRGFLGNGETIADCDVFPDTSAADRDLEAQIAWLLGEESPLSPQQREIVSAMYESDGAMIKAAADLLGLKPSSVRTQLQRVREKISGGM